MRLRVVVTDAFHGTSAVVAPLAWLALLIALFFSSDRRAEALRRGGFEVPKRAGVSIQHRFFGVLAAAKIAATLGVLLLASAMSHGRTEQSLEQGIQWVAFAVVAVCSYQVSAGIIRDALEPMPALAEPALALLRWLSSLTLGVVVLADLSLLPEVHALGWLRDARLSCAICVFALEAGLLVMLLANLRQLGLFVRSRSVGLSLGLAALGLADMLWSLGVVMSRPAVCSAALGVMLAAVATWMFYIVVPDRERLQHALNPRSLLMTWKELAPQLSSNLPPVEKAPFITVVETKVHELMIKYGVESGVR